MRTVPFFRCSVAVILSVFTLTATALAAPSGHRITKSFNAAWKWIKQDVTNGQASTVSDAAWESIGIPHCYNDWDAFDGHFDQQAMYDYWKGAVWYRKHFTLPAEFSAGRRIYIEFEGASQQVDVWLNGTKLGMHKGSSIPFVFDITPYAKFGGADNLLAVKCDNSDKACFAVPGGTYWHTDSYGGIWRNVNLHVTDNLHIPINVYQFQNSWGTYAATLAATTSSASIAMHTQVKNSNTVAKNCQLFTRFINAQGQEALSMEATQTIAAGTTYEFSQTGTMANPKLWSPDAPNLYTIYSIVVSDNDTVDVFTTTFGVRAFEFRNTGFFCNGKPYKLKGFGFRQGSSGGFSNAISSYMHDKEMRLAKETGANFMREGHSAASPAVIDACDKYGLFLCHPTMCNETNYIDRKSDDSVMYFNYKKEFQRDIVVRDRNHPSVLLYEFANGPISAKDADTLTQIIKKWDFLKPRPTTSAGNFCEACPQNVDVYGVHQFWQDCALKNPAKGCICFEYGWDFNVAYRQQQLGDLIAGAKHLSGPGDNNGMVNFFEQSPQWVGACLWTLEETPGEAQGNIGPCSGFGILDAGGMIPKAIYYAFEAAWSAVPKVRIAGAWDQPDSIPFAAFGSKDVATIELFIGTLSKGSKTIKNRSCWGWNPWQSGTAANGWKIAKPTAGTVIHAIAKNGAGTEVARDTIIMFGPATKVVLTADPATIKADGGDCTYIYATVVDVNGVWNRSAQNVITFNPAGPVNYRGGFNHDTAQNSTGKKTLHAEAGKIAVGIRSTNTPGTISMTATSPGLAQGSITVKSEPVDTLWTSATWISPLPESCGPWVHAKKLPGGALQVTYFAPRSGPVSIVVLDLKGRVLCKIVDTHTKAGRGGVVLNKATLPEARGVYLVRATSPALGGVTAKVTLQ